MRAARGLLLLASLAACSGQLDLGHDRKRDGDLVPPATRSAASCRGTPCFAGPILDLATSDGNAKGLVIDAQSAYWAAPSGNAVMITPKSGGASRRVKTLSGGPFRVDQDDFSVYFTSSVGGYVASTPKTPQAVIDPKLTESISMLATGEAEPASLLVASEGVYFADQRSGELKRIDLDTLLVSTLATGIYSGAELTLDATRLYYTDSGLGELHALDRLSGDNTLLLSGLEHPGAPLRRGSMLYFVELGTAAASYADGRLLRMPSDGGPLEVLLEQLDAPSGLAADADAVYVCTRGDELNGYRGRIVRRADDGQISTLATDQAEPFAVAVDDGAVFWTADAVNTLRSIRR